MGGGQRGRMGVADDGGLGVKTVVPRLSEQLLRPGAHSRTGKGIGNDPVRGTAGLRPGREDVFQVVEVVLVVNGEKGLGGEFIRLDDVPVTGFLQRFQDRSRPRRRFGIGIHSVPDEFRGRIMAAMFVRVYDFHVR